MLVTRRKNERKIYNLLIVKDGAKGGQVTAVTTTTIFKDGIIMAE